MNEKPLLITAQPYGHRIVLCKTKKELLSFIKKNKITEDFIPKGINVGGFSLPVAQENSVRQFIIVFCDSERFKDNKPALYAVLAHELHHVVNFIFKDIGEQGDVFEAPAYLMGYLYEKFVKELCE